MAYHFWIVDMGILGIFFIVLLVLKLTGLFSIPWFAIIMPLVAWLVLICVTLILNISKH